MFKLELISSIRERLEAQRLHNSLQYEIKHPLHLTNGICIDKNGMVLGYDRVTHSIYSINNKSPLHKVVDLSECSCPFDQTSMRLELCALHQDKYYFIDHQWNCLYVLSKDGRMDRLEPKQENLRNGFRPCMMRLSPSGEIYVAESKGYHERKIRKFDRNGDICNIAISEAGSYNRPWSQEDFSFDHLIDMSIGQDGKLYVAAGCRSSVWLIQNNKGKPLGHAPYYGCDGEGENSFFISSMTLHPNGDLYILDSGNSRICRIDKNNTIHLILGNICKNNDIGLDEIDEESKLITGNDGHIYFVTGDRIVFKIIEYSKESIQITPSKWDSIDGSRIYAFQPLLSLNDPLFLLNVKKYSSQFNKIQEEIINTMLHDSTNGYLSIERYDAYDPVDILSVVSLSNSDIFQPLKSLAIHLFTKNSKRYNPKKLNDYGKFKGFDPLIYNWMLLYKNAVECMDLRKSIDFISSINVEVFEKGFIEILRTKASIYGFTDHLSLLSKSFFKLVHNIQKSQLPKLFNHKESSDIIIQISDKKFYCHKTVLSSSSQYFKVLFNSDYSDSDDAICIMDGSVHGSEFNEAVIKYCYDIYDSVMEKDPIDMLVCSSFYDIPTLSFRISSNIVINDENYVTIIDQLYGIHTDVIKDKLMDFLLYHRKRLFKDVESVLKLPQPLRDDLLYFLLTR